MIPVYKPLSGIQMNYHALQAMICIQYVPLFMKNTHLSKNRNLQHIFKENATNLQVAQIPISTCTLQGHVNQCLLLGRIYTCVFRQGWYIWRRKANENQDEHLHEAINSLRRQAFTGGNLHWCEISEWEYCLFCIVILLYETISIFSSCSFPWINADFFLSVSNG